MKGFSSKICIIVLPFLAVIINMLPCLTFLNVLVAKSNLNVKPSGDILFCFWSCTHIWGNNIKKDVTSIV